MNSSKLQEAKITEKQNNKCPNNQSLLRYNGSGRKNDTVLIQDIRQSFHNKNSMEVV